MYSVSFKLLQWDFDSETSQFDALMFVIRNKEKKGGLILVFKVDAV